MGSSKPKTGEVEEWPPKNKSSFDSYLSCWVVGDGRNENTERVESTVGPTVGLHCGLDPDIRHDYQRQLDRLVGYVDAYIEW